MTAMTALYIINGIIAFLALALVFAPSDKMGGAARRPLASAPEPEEDDIIFPPGVDEEDTLPFIRLPFSQALPQEPIVTELRISQWPDEP